MIRALRTSDMDRVASIWLETNLQAHSFIPAEYWKSNLEYVREALPLAEVHVYEDAQGVQGFIGLNGDHVEGLFVAAGMQSHGIGKQLMDHVKRRRDALTLEAYRKNVDRPNPHDGSENHVRENLDENHRLIRNTADAKQHSG